MDYWNNIEENYGVELKHKKCGLIFQKKRWVAYKDDKIIAMGNSLKVIENELKSI